MIDKCQPKILPKRANFRRYDLNIYNLKTNIVSIFYQNFCKNLKMIAGIYLNVDMLFIIYPMCVCVRACVCV